MINTALDFISNNISVDVVCSDKIVEQYRMSTKGNINLHVVNDPRSAMFYAFGLKTVNSKISILIIDSECESDIVSGLTESWFQKIGVWVFILNSQKLILNNFNSRNCVGEFIDLDEGNLQTALNRVSYDKQLPIVFNIKDEEITYQSKYIFEQFFIDEVSDASSFIDISDNITFKSKLRSENYRYVISKGCISRYVGSLQIKKSATKVLMTTYEEAMQSINAFALPYVNERFKLIILKRSGSNELIEWIKSNNIEILSGLSSISIMMNTNRPCVLFYEI